MRKTSNFLMRTLALAMVGAVSISSCPVQAASVDGTTQLDVDSAVEGSYIYGTVNLPYADYYYGELNEVQESADLSLNTEDKAAALRAEGYLDAISSATTSKWKNYGATYFGDHENGDGGGYIYGIGNCSVAIPSSLYEEAKALVEDETADAEQCKNPLLSLVAEFKANEDQTTVPAEYKILNGDGTLTEMKDSAEVIKVDTTAEGSVAVATIENNTKYGHYQVDITDENLPEREAMEGVILEATDAEGNVTKYALLHSDNLWFQTGHIAFAVNDGFVVHNNTLKYAQFSDIQGKNITKVTYINRDGADVEYTTDLYCKYLLEDEYGYAGENAVYAEGAQIQFAKNTPEDSNYRLTSVAFGTKVLVAETDYTYDAEGNTLTIKATDNTGIGKYTLTYSDEKYENIVVEVQFTSDMTTENIKLENDKLVIVNSNVAIADYVAAIDSITVNGSKLRSVKGVINEDGSVNFDATITSKGNTTIVFPDAGTQYTLEITAAGYPSVSGKVTSPAAMVAIDTAELKSVIDQAKALVESDYTAETWTVLRTKLAEAEAEFASPQSQETVAAVVVQLKTAIAGLVKKVVQTVPDDTQNNTTTTNPPATDNQTPVNAETKTVKKGATYTVKNLKYKVTKASMNGKGTVEVVAPKNKKVKSVTIPATVKIEGATFNVTSIGKNAFKKCSKLKKITIKTKNLKKVGAGAFKGIHKNAKIKVPSSKLKQYKKLLKGKGQGSKVKITK